MSKANEFTEDTIPTPEENGVLDEPIPAAAAPPEDDISVFLDDEDTPPNDPVSTEDVPETPAPTTTKPKRASRKKKVEAEPAPDETDTAEETITEDAEEAAESPVMLDDEALDSLMDDMDETLLPPPPPVSRSTAWNRAFVRYFPACRRQQHTYGLDRAFRNGISAYVFRFRSAVKRRCVLSGGVRRKTRISGRSNQNSTASRYNLPGNRIRHGLLHFDHLHSFWCQHP